MAHTCALSNGQTLKNASPCADDTHLEIILQVDSNTSEEHVNVLPAHGEAVEHSCVRMARKAAVTAPQPALSQRGEGDRVPAGRARSSLLTAQRFAAAWRAVSVQPQSLGPKAASLRRQGWDRFRVRVTSLVTGVVAPTLVTFQACKLLISNAFS